MKKAKKKSATAKIMMSKKTKRAARSTKNVRAKKTARVKTKSVGPGDGLLNGLKTVVSKMSDIADGVASVFQKDVVSALKQDHDGLRQYLSTLKDSKKPMAERRKAYAQFVPLLKSHSTAEENAVYKKAFTVANEDLKSEIAEGFVEHEVCNDIIRRMEDTSDELSWSAHANVLAEIVKHHLDEEEKELFPEIRKTASPELNMDMLTEFMSLRGETQVIITKENAGALAQLQ